MKGQKQFDEKFYYLSDDQKVNAKSIDKQMPKIYAKLAEKGNVALKHQHRINKFIETHNLTDKYPAKDLYRWHTLLTASCAQGKNNFFQDHGYDLENSEATLPEFFEAVSKEHGGEVIEYIRKKMEAKEKKKKVVDSNAKALIEEKIKMIKNLKK